MGNSEGVPIDPPNTEADRIVITGPPGVIFNNQHDGVYYRDPQPFNEDIFKREDGKFLLYWYTDRNHKVGSWRITHGAGINSADPSSESIGCGLQYPRHAIPLEDKLVGGKNIHNWTIEFVYRETFDPPKND